MYKDIWFRIGLEAEADMPKFMAEEEIGNIKEIGN